MSTGSILTRSQYEYRLNFDQVTGLRKKERDL